MIDVALPNDFSPRPYQLPLMGYLDNGGRKAIVIWHRRSGKDLTMLHQTAKMMHKRKGAYWHVYPTFAQARKAIWEGFRKDGKRIMENVFPGFTDPKRRGSIVKRKDEQQMMIELKNGSIWRLIGAEKIEIVGAGPVGVVFSEYAVGSPHAARLISPMLRENEGWEVYITTPRGMNHAKDLFDSAIKNPGEWFADVKTIYDTRAYDPDLTIAEEKAKGLPEALIRQEYLCDWTAALAGAVWGDMIDAVSRNGGVTDFDHGFDQVFTSWDIGYTDSTSIWFWRIDNGELQIIDYLEAHGKPLSYYFDEIDRRPYRYVKHWLPHDARQQTLASGVNVLNQCLKHWPGQVAIDPDLDLVDGIQAARWMLQQPIRLHATKCKEGINAIRQYHYEYDEETKNYSPKPCHDWSSHAADAFRYLATVVKVSQMLTKKAEIKAPEPVARPLHHSFTLEQLFEDHRRKLTARRRI